MYRYRCCRCRRTFRHYPEGTTRADQTERLRLFAVICWRLGLSYRGVSTILSGIGDQLVSDDGMAGCPGAGEEASGGKTSGSRCECWGWTGLMCWDGERSVRCWWRWILEKGSRWQLAMWMSMIRRQCSAGWSHWYRELGVSVIVTDDLVMYKVVAQRLNLEHQICQFHVRRWVGRTFKELQNTLPQEWLWVVEEIKELMDELPPEGNKRLYALWKQVAVRRGKGSGQSYSCRSAA